jgi:endonuclease YncB( thermonuclease family)
MTAHFPPPRRFRAVRRPPANVLQFRPVRSRRLAPHWPFAVLPLLAFALVFFWPAAPLPESAPIAAEAPALSSWASQRSAAELEAEQPAVAASGLSGRVQDSESAQFSVCGPGRRFTCVVDGDTFWYRGAKIRIADINTPEVSSPHCAAEAALGARATGRLVELLNAGPFTLAAIDRDTDRYGRQLRVVTRGGASVGRALVDEGLAEPWQGFRREWC